VLPSGKKITVYYPRHISYSAKKIGPVNTYHWTVREQLKAIEKQAEQLDGKFDFVYGHFFVDGGLAAAKIGRKYGIPAYVAYGECSYETEVSGRFRDLRPEELQGIHGIISVSSKNSKDIQSRACAKDIPVFLALNSVNKTVFYPKDKKKCREKFGMPQDDFILGFVGYFIERKGCNRVMQACAGLDGVKLAFAGKGPLKPEGENVVFCQGLKHEDVADFLSAVDVFVLPTLHEGCCNAVIEAMSCGKPVISSDLPFNHDVLHAGNAILVDPNSVPQIRDAVIALRDDEPRRKAMAEQALMDAQALSIDRRAQNILNFIKSTS
jgi:glycosyltransferase involved in cell wall biosynthesis